MTAAEHSMTVLPSVPKSSGHSCKYDATIGSLVAIVESMKESQNKLFPKIDTLGEKIVMLNERQMSNVNDLKLEIRELLTSSKAQSAQHKEVRDGLDMVKQSIQELNSRLSKSESGLLQTVEDIEVMSSRVGVMEAQSSRIIGAFVILPSLLTVISIAAVVYQVVLSFIN